MARSPAVVGADDDLVRRDASRGARGCVAEAVGRHLAGKRRSACARDNCLAEGAVVVFLQAGKILAPAAERGDAAEAISLERHFVRDEGVAGSNPATPTRKTSVKSDLSETGSSDLSRYRDKWAGSVARSRLAQPPRGCPRTTFFVRKT
jgi:hypothetical protein